MNEWKNEKQREWRSWRKKHWTNEWMSEWINSYLYTFYLLYCIYPYLRSHSTSLIKTERKKEKQKIKAPGYRTYRIERKTERKTEIMKERQKGRPRKQRLPHSTASHRGLHRCQSISGLLPQHPRWISMFAHMDQSPAPKRHWMPNSTEAHRGPHKYHC